jgi:hypothetical protein
MPEDSEQNGDICQSQHASHRHPISNSAPKGFRLLRTLEVRSQVQAGETRGSRLPVSQSQLPSFSDAPPSRESGFGLVGLTRAGPRMWPSLYHLLPACTGGFRPIPSIKL